MIDASQVAIIPDPGALETQADTIASKAEGVESVAQSCKSEWNALAGVYEAPEQGLVLNAMNTVVTIAEGVETAGSSVGRVLRTFATNLAGLKTRRSALISDIERHNAAPGMCLVDPVAEAARVAGVQEDEAALRARVHAFNADFEQADSECASDLSGLATSTPGATDKALSAGRHWVTGTTMGVGADMLGRYRQLLVPGPNIQVPSDLRLAPPGSPWVQRPSGLWVDPRSMPPVDPGGKSFTGFEPSKRGVFSADPKAGTPPKWMARTGRGLGAVGVGITVWGSYSDQYNADQVAHPEWSDGQRVASAATNAAVVGGSTAAGAWAGAAGGAKVGAVVGSFFGPGPGTLIGGIVGGVAGGIVGGMAGSKVGEGIKDGAKKIWKGLFG